MTLTLDVLNGLPEAQARAALLDCCGSAEWARRLALARPYRDLEHICTLSDQIWWELDQAAWREAFARHPRIGERAAGSDAAGRWSAAEQGSTRTAARSALEAMAEANRAYETRFGYRFIVCATGRSVDEMLAAARERLGNDPATELRVAAEEQRKITRLRLEKLLVP